MTGGIRGVGTQATQQVTTGRVDTQQVGTFKKWAVRIGRGVLALATAFISEAVIWGVRKWRVSRAQTSPADRQVAMQQIREANRQKAEKFAFPHGVADYVALGYVETKIRNHVDFHFDSLSEDVVDALREKVYQDICNYPGEVSDDKAMEIIKRDSQMLIDSIRIANKFKPGATDDDVLFVYETFGKAEDCLNSLKGEGGLQDYVPKVVDFLRNCSLMGKRCDFGESGLPEFIDSVLQGVSQAHGYKDADFEKIFNKMVSTGYFHLREALYRIGDKLCSRGATENAGKSVMGLEYSLMGVSAFFARKVGKDLVGYEKPLRSAPLAEDVVSFANNLASEQIRWRDANL